MRMKQLEMLSLMLENSYLLPTRTLILRRTPSHKPASGERCETGEQGTPQAKAQATRTNRTMHMAPLLYMSLYDHQNTMMGFSIKTKWDYVRIRSLCTVSALGR